MLKRNSVRTRSLPAPELEGQLCFGFGCACVGSTRELACGSSAHRRGEDIGLTPVSKVLSKMGFLLSEGKEYEKKKIR